MPGRSHSARCRVEDQQGLVDLGPGFLDHSTDLGELIHQGRLRVETPGRIHDQHIRPSSRADFTASNATAPGSAPRCWETMCAPARFAHTSSCSPAAARNVSLAAQTHGVSLAGKTFGELLHGRRLPRSVHTHDGDHRQPVVRKVQVPILAENGEDLLVEDAFRIGAVHEPPANAFHQILGASRTHIRLDEEVLELPPGALGRLAPEERTHARAKPSTGRTIVVPSSGEPARRRRITVTPTTTQAQARSTTSSGNVTEPG